MKQTVTNDKAIFSTFKNSTSHQACLGLVEPCVGRLAAPVLLSGGLSLYFTQLAWDVCRGIASKGMPLPIIDAAPIANRRRRKAIEARAGDPRIRRKVAKLIRRAYRDARLASV